MNFSSNAWHALADIIWHVACKAGSARRRRFFAAMAWTKGPVIALAVALPLPDDAHAAGTLDKPLTGQPQAISPQNAINRTPGTLVRVIRDNQVLRTLTTAIPLRLPRRNLVAIDGRSRLTLSDAQSFVIDPEAGDWYALTDQGDGSTLTIEGDNRLLASVGGCANRKDRNIFIGPTYTKPGEVTDTEYGPKKEILAIFDCVPYRALLECDDISDKCDAAKAALNNSALTSLAAPARLDIPERLAPRALLAPSNGPILPPEPRPAGSINEFRYHAPGRTLNPSVSPSRLLQGHGQGR